MKIKALKVMIEPYDNYRNNMVRFRVEVDRVGEKSLYYQEVVDEDHFVSVFDHIWDHTERVIKDMIQKEHLLDEPRKKMP